MRLIVAGLVALLLGATILASGTRAYRAARASVSWPTTEGVVVRSAVVRHEYRGRGARASYEADVRYRYEAGGRAHESRTFAVGVSHTFGTAAEAEAEVAAYAVGRRVRVSYDPRDPSASSLRPGAAAPLGTWVAPLVVLPAVGLALLVAGARSVRRRGGVRRIVDVELLGGPPAR